MSELSELIKINKNIEEQNKEIIRLLKKIAGESEYDNGNPLGYVHLESPYESLADSEDSDLAPVLDDSLDVGEVFFVEDDIFKLSIKNNEVSINNLTGSGDCIDSSLAEIIANESIKNNQSLEDGTVILTETTNGKLPQTIKKCIDAKGKKAFLPWGQSLELVGAPQTLQTMIQIDLYRTSEHLIEKIFD